MKIKVLSARGIHAREVVGVEAFQKRLPSDWYGFANLELVQRAERPRQIDIALVIEDRIVIADLKDWRGVIRSDGRNWYHNDRVEESSPVKKIDENARVLSGELGSYLRGSARRSTSSERITSPFIQGCVILTNTCKIDLADGEERFVFRLDEFCRALASADKRERYRLLGDPPWIDKKEPLTGRDSAWRGRLAGFFGATERFRPQEILYADHRVCSEATFTRRDGLYDEFDVEEATGARAPGLLRLWNFQNAPARYLAEVARGEVAGREQKVIAFLVDRAPDLEGVLLRAKVRDPEGGIRYWEVFERRRQLRRLREFLRANHEQLTLRVREDLVRALVSHVATMHRLGAAHADLGSHSIWLEMPSSVRLSHVLAAHYPELETLGTDRFTFLANDTVLPEMVLKATTTPFQKDVFLLGVVAHEILLGAPPRRNSDNDAPHWDHAADPGGDFAKLHAWLDRALAMDANERFQNAQAMLDAFNQATRQPSETALAYERIAQHRPWPSQRALFREYPETEVLREDALRTAYRSDRDGKSFLVKIWSATHLGDVRLEAARLLAFIERANDLAGREIPGICLPIVAGLAGDGLALIQEFRDALNLEQDMRARPSAWENATAVLPFALALCNAVQALHDAGQAHGDVSPANILVLRDDWESMTPLLVDLFDLPAVGEGELRTPAYAPLFPADATERDRFGALRICEDLLRSAVPTRGAERIAEAIATCREGPPRLASLQPLLDALRTALDPEPGRQVLNLRFSVPRGKHGAMLPDDGVFRVVPDIRPGRAPAKLQLCGACEELVVELDVASGIRAAYVRPLTQSEARWREQRSIATVAGSIEVLEGPQDLTELLPVLDLPEVVAWRTGGLQPPPASVLAATTEDAAESLDIAVPTAEPSVVDEDLDAGAGAPQAVDVLPDVRQLWRTFLQVEGEQFNKALLEEDSQYLRRQRRHIARYVMTAGTLDYEMDEPVQVEVLTKGGVWRRIGLLDVQRTTSTVLAIDASSTKLQDGGQLLRAGSELRFVGVRDAESRSRRQAAMDVILDRRGGIPGLVEYFASDAPAPAGEIGGANGRLRVSPEEVEEMYGLNPAQAEALAHIWSARPLGLLQGPPGTGKTTFIAALVHHALTAGGVRNVLLASQSHEAVNNVAEEVLKLFRKFGEEPSLVRVGQEGQVSERLKAFHSASVEARYREQFRARLKDKLRLVGKQIAASDTFIDDVFFLEATLRPILWRIAEHAEGRSMDVGDAPAAERIEDLRGTALRLLEEHSLPVPAAEELSEPEAFERIVFRLADETKGATRDQARRLLELVDLGRDWLNSVSSRHRNFESFLVGTRQIVAGTCVGLGRSSFAPAPGSFDLVVIDEAARCSAGELAVPMQAGRWVVLVGDHAQLEPQYEPVLIAAVVARLGCSEAVLRQSDFERAFRSPYGVATGRTLLTQYRMLPPIGRLVSDAYYDGRLGHGRAAPDVPPEALPPMFDKALLWVDTSAQGKMAHQSPAGRGKRSLVNEAEANQIVEFLLQLDAYGPFQEWLAQQPSEAQPVGIICMYAAQRDLLRRRMAMTQISEGLRRACKVETVDSYQGKQNTFVLLSLVRNNDDGGARTAVRQIKEGFLSRPNRVNVAMSRARDRLVIFGSLSRWPEGSPMARVASLARQLADEGEARIVDKL